MADSGKIVVIGIGNDFRRDDSIGLVVARRLKESVPPGVSIVEGVPDGYALVETWSDAAVAILVDCCQSRAQAGTIVRFDAINDSIPADVFGGWSTHAISLVTAIELARELQKLPQSLIVYGIEGTDFASGTDLSPQLEAAAEEVTQRILEEIKRLQT